MAFNWAALGTACSAAALSYISTAAAATASTSASLPFPWNVGPLINAAITALSEINAAD